MKALPVPVEQVPTLWPHVEGWFQAAIEKGDRWWTIEEAYRRACLGQLAMWVAANDDHNIVGAALCEISDYSDRKVCHVALMGGRGLKGLVSVLPKIEAWAKWRGCSESIIRGRKGWQRALPDYRPAFVELSKRI